eukprot:7020295-Pyramimonas_sp.AAC.1
MSSTPSANNWGENRNSQVAEWLNKGVTVFMLDDGGWCEAATTIRADVRGGIFRDGTMGERDLPHARAPDRRGGRE